MNNKKTKKTKIIIGVVFIIVLIIGIFIAYDKITVNKQYSINEKNLKIPIFVYHNIVSDKSEVRYDYMQTAKEDFEKQIKGLKRMRIPFYYI